jgi:hypothetical protein
MNDNLFEGESDDPPLVLLSGRGLARFSDHKVLSGPITPLGYAGLYLGHDNHVYDNESVQPDVRFRLSFLGICLGNGCGNLSWMR